jgi:hypothetical protein
VPSIVDEEDVWAATLEATAGHRGEALQVLVCEDDAPLAGLAIKSGFAMTDEIDSGHTPALSRPKELADYLEAYAAELGMAGG